MEAKDTVTKTTVYNCHNTVEERLLEQAEISFKAGREAGYWEGRELGLRDGRREVVEWMAKYHRDEGGLELMLSWHGLVIDDAEWQAFLKSKGIEEEPDSIIPQVEIDMIEQEQRLRDKGWK